MTHPTTNPDPFRGLQLDPPSDRRSLSERMHEINAQREELMRREAQRARETEEYNREER